MGEFSGQPVMYSHHQPVLYQNRPLWECAICSISCANISQFLFTSAASLLLGSIQPHQHQKTKKQKKQNTQDCRPRWGRDTHMEYGVLRVFWFVVFFFRIVLYTETKLIAGWGGTWFRSDGAVLTVFCFFMSFPHAIWQCFACLLYNHKFEDNEAHKVLIMKRWCD